MNLSDGEERRRDMLSHKQQREAARAAKRLRDEAKRAEDRKFAKAVKATSAAGGAEATQAVVATIPTSVVGSEPFPCGNLVFTNTVIHVDPNRVRVGKQPRSTINKEALLELTENIRQNGQNEPAQVFPIEGDPDHDFEILKGHRRRKACIQLECKLIVVVGAEPGSPEARLTEQALSNMFREDHAPIDEARLIQDYLDLGLSLQRIGQKLKMKDLALARRLALLKLDPRILAKMEAEVNEKDRLGPGIAYEISRLPQARQWAAFEFIIKHKLTIQQTQRYVRDLLLPSGGFEGYKRRRQVSPASTGECETSDQALSMVVSRNRQPSDDRLAFDDHIDRMSRDAAVYADFIQEQYVLMFAPRSPQKVSQTIHRAERVVSNMLAVVQKLRAARSDVEVETDWMAILKLIFGSDWRKVIQGVKEQ